MKSGPQFRILGIPVRVDPFFVIVIFILGLSWSTLGTEYLASWMIIASSSVLLHELGHAVAFKAFGVQPSIALVGLGGLTTGEGRLTPARHIVVSLAGPLATLILIGVPALVYRASDAQASVGVATILEQIIFVNVLWALLNLAPVLPLDGGQVVASLLEMVFGERGRQLAVALSLVIGGGLIIIGVTQDLFFLTFIGGIVLVMNIGQLFTGSSRSTEGIGEAHRALVHGQPGEAERLLVQSLEGRLDPTDRAEAMELLAWSRVLRDDPWGAHHAISSGQGSYTRLLSGALAMSSGRPDEGLAVLTWGFVNEPPSHAKLFAAIAIARASLTARFAHELSLLGPSGLEALRTFAELLAYVGLTHDAEEALRAGRSGPPAVSG